MININNHIDTPMRVDAVPMQPSRIGNHAGIGLAVQRVLVLAAQAVVVEKRPEAGSIQIKVGAVGDDVIPRHAALGVAVVAVGEIRVVVLVQRGPGVRGQAGRSGALPVWRFRLLHADEDVARPVEIVLVEGVVLGGRSVEPGRRRGFHQDSATGRDRLIVIAVQVVIGRPEPHILNVGGRRRGQMQEHESGFAFGRRPGAVGPDSRSSGTYLLSMMSCAAKR